MPRIYDSASNPVDYCLGCFPSEAKAELLHGNVGDGPDGRGNCFGYDCEHPDYDGEEYVCEGCGRLLRARDNHGIDAPIHRRVAKREDRS